jgi:tricorn protease
VWPARLSPEASVAYAHMTDTAFGGFTNLNRYFFAQIGKEAAIMDERFKEGGLLVEERSPAAGGAIFGHKVMIINEFAGPGGDAMPWYFKRGSVGKLIRQADVGQPGREDGSAALMDDGFVSAPSLALWNPNGQ